jgi:hypothetical protein
MSLLKVTVTLVFLSLAAHAETEMDFDDIVNNLSSNRASAHATPTGDPLEDVQIHLGAALTNGVFSIQHADGTSTQANQRGVQVNLGIDMFSPNVVAEGTIMSDLQQQYDNATVGLQEFDLKLFYKDFLEPQVDYRLGGGLAARYLSVTPKAGPEEKYTTPAWIAIGGLDLYVTRGLSLGAEVAGRGSLTGETPDQSSVDFSLRLDAHF